jgi:hypothetical protein
MADNLCMVTTFVNDRFLGVSWQSVWQVFADLYMVLVIFNGEACIAAP